jgi:GntR family transcriptional regulator/MocR family aminotransferase
MTPTPATPLAVTLDRDGGDTLPVQVAGQVRRMAMAGTLEPGRRLPSTRALATELGVARAVTEAAYDQLLAEGWVTTRRGAGTFVSDVGSDSPRSVKRSRRQPRGRLLPRAGRVVFDTGTPYVDPRLGAGWRRAWREMATATPPRGYPDPAGLPELRELLAAYVARTRGVDCGAQEVLVTAGTTHGLSMLLDRLPDGSVAVEDPGYRAAVDTARARGFEVVDVPVDRDGIVVPALRAAASDDVRAVYVTPAHQHPTGATLSATRRMALIAEARRRDAWIIEDDYDSEFRYDVAPLPALASLSSDVCYLGTAAKAVHPSLRLGWLVGPSDLVAELAVAAAARHDHASWPAQRAFLAMLRDGHVDRLIRSARRVYAERAELVRTRLGGTTRVDGAGAGMYVTLPMKAGLARAAQAACARAGFEVPQLAAYARSHPRDGLVLGFGGVTDAELSRCLDVVEAVLAGV